MRKNGKASFHKLPVYQIYSSLLLTCSMLVSETTKTRHATQHQGQNERGMNIEHYL